MDYSTRYLEHSIRVREEMGVTSVESVCSSAVKAAVDANCPLIIALTETGHTAQMLAKYRPQAPILAITASESTVRQLLVTRGVIPTLTASFVGTDAVITKAVDRAKTEGLVKSGDCVVAVHGQREECPGQSTLMKIVIVP